MAGSFTSPGASSSTKMHVGKVNRPKRTKSGEAANRPSYPITDSFASTSIPKSRRDGSCHRKSFSQR